MELTRGQEVEAVGDIQLGSGFIFPKGTKGVVIGMSTDKETVSVQFEDYTGAVSVWTSLVKPATEAPAQPATADAGAVHPEALAAQMVHAQMVLQDALGYEQNDYDVSLTDLAEDIEALQAKLTAAEARADAALAIFTPYKTQLEQLQGLTLEGDIVIRHDLSRSDVSKLIRQGFLSQVNSSLWITTAAEMLMQSANALASAHGKGE